MNHAQHNQIISFIWSIADDVLRDVFVRGKYRDVILPMTVLRRLDALLEPTKDRVLETYDFIEENNIGVYDALGSPDQGSGYPFWNTSPYTLRRLLDSPTHIEHNFRAYLDGYSPNVRDIIEKFRLRDQIKTLVEADALYLLIGRFTDTNRINLSPDATRNALGAVVLPGLDNRGMGYVFEELLRKFNEENNEEAGEHFTPRDIIELMTHLVFEPVYDALPDSAPIYIYDDACGSGGMLTLAKEFLQKRGDDTGKSLNISLFGQEVNPETFAICQIGYADFGAGCAQHQIRLDSIARRASRFARRLHARQSALREIVGQRPRRDLGQENQDRSRPDLARLAPNGDTLHLTPASSDGQLLFTVNMLSKMVDTAQGSRIAVVHNGSALFTGDAGSGESNIRRWMLENDWLEAIIALPLRMFYNTGIATYIWVFSNRKAPARAGKVQLIDASQQFHKLRKNLGQKGHEFNDDDIQSILTQLMKFEDAGASKIFPTSEFIYRKVCVERPLRLRVDLSKRSGDAKFDAVIEKMADEFGADKPMMDYTHLKLWTEHELKVKWKAKDWKKFRELCCERDENAEPVYEKPGYFELKKVGILIDSNDSSVISGKQEADPQLRDWENVPYDEENEREVIERLGGETFLYCGQEMVYDESGEPISFPSEFTEEEKRQLAAQETISDYFRREVEPHAPDAWIDETQTRIGAEISFTKHFYQPAPLRPLAEITREILELETQTEGVLHRLAQELGQ